MPSAAPGDWDPGIHALFIVGPTASGKSAIALELAERLDGEILTADSMQVYRGLDIGTAKPLSEERGRVPHHLIDLTGLEDSFDAARWVAKAQDALVGVLERGRTPIVCGGTGLYVKAWLDGLGEAPRPDPALRAELESTPLDQLLRELEQADPVTRARIDGRNPRRVIRAVEVIRLTGRPYAEQRAAWARPGQPQRAIYAMDWDAGRLNERIDARVDRMFATGLVEETRGLAERGLRTNRTAAQALGYRQVLQYLDGAATLEETKAEVKLRTRQFARRQRTWFRHQLDVEWLAVEGESSLETAGRRIRREWTKRRGSPTVGTL